MARHQVLARPTHCPTLALSFLAGQLCTCRLCQMTQSVLLPLAPRQHQLCTGHSGQQDQAPARPELLRVEPQCRRCSPVAPGPGQDTQPQSHAQRVCPCTRTKQQVQPNVSWPRESTGTMQLLSSEKTQHKDVLSQALQHEKPSESEEPPELERVKAVGAELRQAWGSLCTAAHSASAGTPRCCRRARAAAGPARSPARTRRRQGAGSPGQAGAAPARAGAGGADSPGTHRHAPGVTAQSEGTGDGGCGSTAEPPRLRRLGSQGRTNPPGPAGRGESSERPGLCSPQAGPGPSWNARRSLRSSAAPLQRRSAPLGLRTGSGATCPPRAPSGGEAPGLGAPRDRTGRDGTGQGRARCRYRRAALPGTGRDRWGCRREGAEEPEPPETPVPSRPLPPSRHVTNATGATPTLRARAPLRDAMTQGHCTFSVMLPRRK